MGVSIISSVRVVLKVLSLEVGKLINLAHFAGFFYLMYLLPVNIIESGGSSEVCSSDLRLNVNFIE